MLVDETEVGYHPVREEALVVPDTAILETFGMRGQGICQAHLIDHSYIETDIHTGHTQVQEVDRVTDAARGYRQRWRDRRKLASDRR